MTGADCGETWLALRLAALAAGGFGDGVRLVELAFLPDPALVPTSVIAVRAGLAYAGSGKGSMAAPGDRGGLRPDAGGCGSVWAASGGMTG